jgi:hypothetical protein
VTGDEMDEHKDAAQRIDESAGLCDELRLKKHLLRSRGSCTASTRR